MTSARRGDGFAVDETGRLNVQVQGGGGDAERVLRIAPPSGGRVQVWEWSAAAGREPREYEASARELYDGLAAAAGRGRRVSEDLYRLRRWLLEEGP